MALVRCVRGETVNADVFMLKADGTPAIGIAPPTWNIRDQNGILVASGTGIQDMDDPSHWGANFAIPTAAPLAIMGEKYQISWSLNLQGGGTQSAIERFEVVPEGDPIRPVNQTDQLIAENSFITDCLYVPTKPITGKLHYAIKDVNGTIVYEKGDIQATNPTRQFRETYCYDVTSNQPVSITSDFGAIGFAPYFGEWTYTLPGESPTTEFHAIYVINMKMVMMMNSLRKLIDRAHLADIHPDLAFTDIDLAHYILRGIEKVNSHSPTVTQFSTVNLPQNFVDITIKAAAVEALNAQFLAEGMKAFNFSGLSVSLELDRTNYIQTLADKFENEVEGNLTRQKRMWVRNGGFSGNAAGAMALSIGPFTNFIYNAGSLWNGLAPYQRGVAFLALRSIGQ